MDKKITKSILIALGIYKADDISLNAIYTKKLNKWFFYNSDEKKVIKVDITKHKLYPRNKRGDFPDDIPIFNIQGNIINAEFSKTDKYKSPLTETEFLSEHINYLNHLNSEQLLSSDKRLFKRYMDFVNDRLDYLTEKKESKKLDAKTLVYIEFAKGTIIKKKNQCLYFNGIQFKNNSLLAREVEKHLNITTTDIRPYISETFNRTISGNNFYNNERQLKIVKQHCEKNNIETTDEFKNTCREFGII